MTATTTRWRTPCSKPLTATTAAMRLGSRTRHACTYVARMLGSARARWPSHQGGSSTCPGAPR
eukprot:7330732-Pyramimonas_sp.AAC.1